MKLFMFLLTVASIFACAFAFGYLKGRFDEEEYQRKMRAKIYNLKEK